MRPEQPATTKHERNSHASQAFRPARAQTRGGQSPVFDQSMVSGSISGVPTSSWTFSCEPSGTLRGFPLNT